MTNDKSKKSFLSTFFLVCLLLAVVVLFHQLVLAVAFLCLFMAAFDILEKLLPRCITVLKILIALVIDLLTVWGPKWTGLLIDRGRLWLKRERGQVIYVGSVEERKAKLFANHMNNPDLTSREFYKWQDNIERIEKNRKSEH